jgi:hypothetical protein
MSLVWLRYPFGESYELEFSEDANMKPPGGHNSLLEVFYFLVFDKPNYLKSKIRYLVNVQ